MRCFAADSLGYDPRKTLGAAKATPDGPLNYMLEAPGHVARIASSNPNGASMSCTYDEKAHSTALPSRNPLEIARKDMPLLPS